MHRIAIDRNQAMVSLVLAGFFSLDDVTSAAADLHAAIRSLGSRMGMHVTLYDMSDLQVAAAPVLERFGRYFSDPAMKPLWARRVAIVSNSALVQMQMQRICRDNMRVFAMRTDAVTWLLEDQGRPRTISHPTAASG